MPDAVTGSKKGRESSQTEGDYLGERCGCKQAVHLCSVLAPEVRIVEYWSSPKYVGTEQKPNSQVGDFFFCDV